jgi:predicted oxidoreductase
MGSGLNFFDHADLYGGGKSEQVFSEAIGMNDDVREKIILQSKCGICPGKVMFDFSKEHIIKSTEGCLKRLGTDYLDFLLLHRPDTLYEPEEVAEAFAYLKESGKVRHFGVSNQNPMQMRLLQKYLGEEPICANQLQFSITDCHIVKQGLYVNMREDNAIDRDGGVLEYCRYEDITIQAWSPFQYGFFEGVYVDNPDFPEINAKLQELADKYGLPRAYTQTIQPWWFARDEHDEENYHEKTTCLWEIGVPPLVAPRACFNASARFVTTTGKSFPAWYSKTSLRGRGDRRVVRSKTFPGIAKAKAEQWG